MHATSSLVVQNIRKDTEWLQLEEGKDFEGCIDLAGLTRVYNPKYSSYTHFGLDHVATSWLGESLEGASHDALGDAAKSMRVYLRYLEMSGAGGATGGGAAAPAAGATISTRSPLLPAERPPPPVGKPTGATNSKSGESEDIACNK